MSQKPLILQRTLKEYDSPVGLIDPVMGIKLLTFFASIITNLST